MLAVIAGEEEHLTGTFGELLRVVLDALCVSEEEKEEREGEARPAERPVPQTRPATYRELKAQMMGVAPEERIQPGEQEAQHEPAPAHLPSRSQMTKGKVVPPSVMALAGPSTELPEVLPTAAYQPDAVFPGTHVPSSLPGS